MSEERFSNREITAMFTRIEEKLDDHAKTHDAILRQVTYTNGKVKKITLWLVIIGTATLTLLATKGSVVVDFILKILV